jgi:hypothetical protein
MESSENYLLWNHIDCVLDAAIRNDREDRGIDHTQFLDTVDLELAIDDALFDALGKACSATWILFQLAMLYLSEILLTVVPVLDVSTKWDPVIGISFAASDPSVVVQARTPAENFTSGVRFLETSIFRTICECGLVGPIIRTVTELESTYWSSDLRNFMRVAGQ